MRVRIVFGQLLLSVSKTLKKWSLRLTNEVSGQDDTTESKILIWGILDGPFSSDDFPEEDLYEMGIPDDWNYMIVAHVQTGGKLGSMNFWYETLDEAYDVINYFKNNIEPLEVDDNG